MGIEKTIPAEIRRARDAAGLTQNQLARLIGRKQFDISRFEHGARLPSLHLLKAISNELPAFDFARAFGVAG